MNKYQDALNRVKTTMDGNSVYKEYTNSYSFFSKDINTLQELINEKSNKPTIDEIKQEWKELGYVWTEGIMYIHLIKLEKDICIRKTDKEYECYDADDYDGQSLTLTFKEHQLLTKTFKALGWEE